MNTATPTALTTHINISDCNANQTGNQPLKASPSNVNKAADFLPLRNTLVAPGLPLPTVRGSAKPKTLAD